MRNTITLYADNFPKMRCINTMANNYIFFCYHFQVCELDIIFNFEKAYFILDELLLGGEIQETSKKNVLKAIAAQDLLQEVSDGDTAIEL